MSVKEIWKDLVTGLMKISLSVKETQSKQLGSPKNILIVRQHNQFGDLLASVSLFRAVKETYPEAHLTVIASPQNYFAVVKNKYIDELFVFDKRKILNYSYLKRLRRLLKRGYDLAITPSTVSISLTSLLLMRFSDSGIRIGVNSLNGKPNKYNFLFDRRIDLDWNAKPDAHVSDFILDLVRPFGIDTGDFSSSVDFTGEDIRSAKKFIEELGKEQNDKLIGLHVGAGKPKNRWSLDKYIELIRKLNSVFPVKFYLTGSSSDNEEISYVKNNLGMKTGVFLNRSIPELAALISESDLFVTNDTGVMHVAGTTGTPQVSIFGPTNPFNWAPIGANKYFIRKSDLIDDVEVEDVFNICKKILSNEKMELNEFSGN